MKEELQALTELINKEIDNLNIYSEPTELYEPIRYIMQLGGKRLRPLLTLLSYSIYNEDVNSIIRPAIAVELFHNFTLMHDDIMDQAPLRRGKPTVHQKWNNNVAILSGDVMLVKVYDLLLEVPGDKIKRVLAAFNKCAAEVCEGQQFDMNFEKIFSVGEEEYLKMISLKTAVLLGFSLELGAILGGADEVACRNFYDFGKYMGLGFQLKDDLLDVYADSEKFGKQVGGDIISNKKTFLLIKALEIAEGKEKEDLVNWINKKTFDNLEKVSAIKCIYDKLHVKRLTEEKIHECFNKSFESFSKLSLGDNKGVLLLAFAQNLINREN